MSGWPALHTVVVASSSKWESTKTFYDHNSFTNYALGRFKKAFKVWELSVQKFEEAMNANANQGPIIPLWIYWRGHTALENALKKVSFYIENRKNLKRPKIMYFRNLKLKSYLRPFYKCNQKQIFDTWKFRYLLGVEKK